MWADNEADIDLLGFEYLVDGLVIALTQPRLLPVTVGLLGDWGSGKSSLMRLAAQELDPLFAAGDSDQETESRHIAVAFSPWQYEDHDDVKVSLMFRVLDAIQARVPATATRVSRLRKFASGLRTLGRGLGRSGAALAPSLTPVLMQAIAPGTDPMVSDAIGASAAVAAKQVETLLEEPDDSGESDAVQRSIIDSVDEFRKEFEALVASIPDCDSVIVFIDDLDRCLPDTVVDTFEAIRLFLNTPKTAYVVALNQDVVEAAIDSRYPELKKQDGGGIGRDYLEKMLQLKLGIPPLSAPEAETYVNLLFAELRLGANDFERVLAAAEANRRQNSLAVAFNAGIAGHVLGDIPAELAADMRWAAAIAPVLGSSLRGNPRQLKRFLNGLLLKHLSAERRGIELNLPVLAKLMVLEDQYHSDFQKLFDWEIAAGGACPELSEAEGLARSHPNGFAGLVVEEGGFGTNKSSKPVEPVSIEKAKETSDVYQWAASPYITAWLATDPPLADVDLLPYFTYSRDKLSFGVSASRLAPHLQKMLVELQSSIVANRRRVYTAAQALPSGERAQLVDALLDRVQRDPAGVGFTAVLELAEHSPDIVSSVCSGLDRIPVQSIPRAIALTAVQRLPGESPEVAKLLDRWEEGANKQLAAGVKLARSKKGSSSGNVR